MCGQMQCHRSSPTSCSQAKQAESKMESSHKELLSCVSLDRRRTRRNVIRLPDMSDSCKVAVMRVKNTITTGGYISRR